MKKRHKTTHGPVVILSARQNAGKKNFDSPSDRNPVIQKFCRIPKSRWVGISNQIAKADSRVAGAIRAKQALLRYTTKAHDAPTIALISLLSDINALTSEIGIDFSYTIKIP